MQRPTALSHDQFPRTSASEPQHCALADHRTMQRVMRDAWAADPNLQLHFSSFTAMLAGEYHLQHAVLVGADMTQGSSAVWEFWRNLNWQVESDFHRAGNGSLKGITTIAAAYVTLWAHIPKVNMLTIVSDDIAALSYPLKKFIDEKGGHCRAIVTWWISSASNVDVRSQLEALARNGVDVHCISEPKDILHSAPFYGILRVSNMMNQQLSKCWSRKVEPYLLGMLLHIQGGDASTDSAPQLTDGLAKWAQAKLGREVRFVKNLWLDSTNAVALPRGIVQVPLLVYGHPGEEVLCPAIAKLLDLCAGCSCGGDVTRCPEARRKTEEPLIQCNHMISNLALPHVRVRLVGISKVFLLSRLPHSQQKAAYRRLTESIHTTEAFQGSIDLPSRHRCQHAASLQQAKEQASIPALVNKVWSLGSQDIGPVLHQYRVKLGGQNMATVLDVQNLLYGIQSVCMSGHLHPCVQGVDPRTRIAFGPFIERYLADTAIFARTGMLQSNRCLAAFLSRVDAEVHALSEEDGVLREHGVDEALVSDCVSLICAAPRPRDFILQIASGDADVMVGAYVACVCGVRVKILHFAENTSEFAYILAREYDTLVEDIRETEIDVLDTELFYQKFDVRSEFNPSRFLRFDFDFSEHEDRMRDLGEGCIREIAAELTAKTGRAWSFQCTDLSEIRCFTDSTEVMGDHARENVRRVVDAAVSTHHMELVNIDSSLARVVLRPKPGWIAARLAATLTHATKLPWMYRESQHNQDVFTFFVPVAIDNDRALLGAAEIAQRLFGAPVQLPRDRGSLDSTSSGGNQVNSTNKHGADKAEDEFQVVASRRTRHAQQKDRRKREKKEKPCPYGVRCKRRFHCDFQHTDHHKVWFQWYEVQYMPLRLNIEWYKASPCRFICAYGQCDHASEPWKCFGMHTLNEMWCPECQTQGKHPWHKCPKTTDEQRAEVLKKQQFLNLYDDMLARGRFQSGRNSSNSSKLTRSDGVSGVSSTNASASESAASAGVSTCPATTNNTNGRNSPCAVADLRMSRSPPRFRSGPATGVFVTPRK